MTNAFERRQFLKACATLAAVSALPSLGARAADYTKMPMPGAPRVGDPLSGASLYADVVRYDGFGVHRSGTKGDLQTTAWLGEELKKAGFAVEHQPFDVKPYFEPTRCDLTFGQTRIEGFPYWPVVLPQSGSLSAPLIRLSPDWPDADAKGKTAVLNFKFRDGELTTSKPYASQIMHAHELGAVAVVVIMENPCGEIFTVNNPWDTPAWPLPVMIVGQKDEKTLATAITTGAQVTFTVQGVSKERAPTDNVVGRLIRGPKWVVVSTPKSGWFTCAGERGSGLAVWLGLARWIAKRKSDVSFLFVATSGHELNYIGAHTFLHESRQGPPPPEKTQLWLHIGANVATRDWMVHSVGKLYPLSTPGPVRILTGTPDMQGILRAAFQGQPGMSSPVVANKDTIGETANVLNAGYQRVAGVSGFGAFHHTPMDHPFVTAPELLEPVAIGFSYVLENEGA